MFATKTAVAAKSQRVDQKTRAANARLAEKSFSTFMREHNAKQARLAQKAGA